MHPASLNSCHVLQVFTRIFNFFNFSRYERCPMWGSLRPRTNEGVSRLKRSMWYEWTRGEFRTGQTIWRVVGFLLFFIYESFSHFFYFKESTTVTTDKQRAKRIQQKIYRNVEDKSLPIVSDYVLPIRQSSPFSFFFFQLVLKLYPHLVFPFTIKGGNFPVFFLFFFFLPKNKSLSSSSLIWIYKF